MTTTGRPTAPANASQPGMPWLTHYPRGVDWHMPLKVAPLYRLLDEAVAGYPDLPCTTFLGKTLTYADIGEQVAHATLGLQRLGVRKGTKVGLFLPNSPTFIVFFFAVLKAGGTIVNFNPLYTVAELAQQVKDSDTELMVTLDLQVLFGKVEALLRGGLPEARRRLLIPSPAAGGQGCSVPAVQVEGAGAADGSPAREKIVLEAEVMAGDGHAEKVAIDPMTDVAVLQYTGGTTGTPKGAMLTHANCYVNAQQVASWRPDLGFGTERVLGVLPFFHVFALTVVMNVAIARAAEIIIMPRFSLDEALKLIDRTQADDHAVRADAAQRHHEPPED